MILTSEKIFFPIIQELLEFLHGFVFDRASDFAGNLIGTADDPVGITRRERKTDVRQRFIETLAIISKVGIHMGLQLLPVGARRLCRLPAAADYLIALPDLWGIAHTA